MKLAAKDPATDAFFENTEDLARQIRAKDFVKASLSAENPAIYRATIAGAFIASADETRQLAHDAMEPIVRDLNETLHEDAMTTEIQFRNMNTRVSSVETSIPNMNNRISNMNTHISDMTTRISDMTTRISDMNTRISDMNTRISALEKDNAELKATNAQLRAEIDQIKVSCISHTSWMNKTNISLAQATLGIASHQVVLR